MDKINGLSAWIGAGKTVHPIYYGGGSIMTGKTMRQAETNMKSEIIPAVIRVEQMINQNIAEAMIEKAFPWSKERQLDLLLHGTGKRF